MASAVAIGLLADVAVLSDVSVRSARPASLKLRHAPSSGMAVMKKIQDVAANVCRDPRGEASIVLDDVLASIPRAPSLPEALVQVARVVPPKITGDSVRVGTQVAVNLLAGGAHLRLRQADLHGVSNRDLHMHRHT